MQPLTEQAKFRTWDGLHLFYRLYPVTESHDILLILHGMGDHSGRYDKFFKHLQSEKITLAAFDFRGHGLSGGSEVYVRSFDDYIQDVTAFLYLIKQKLGQDKRIYLLGHSMGGLVAIHYALWFPKAIQALILSSPCLGLPLSSFLAGFNACVNRWNPHFKYLNPVYPAHLTHSQNEKEIYKKDKLIKRKISALLLCEMLKAMNQIETRETFQFNFPVSILMAGDDRIVDAKKTGMFYEKVKAPLKNKKILEGFYHEIFNEEGQEQAFELLNNEIRAIRSYYAK